MDEPLLTSFATDGLALELDALLAAGTLVVALTLTTTSGQRVANVIYNTHSFRKARSFLIFF